MANANHLASAQRRRAMVRYHRRFDNKIYLQACPQFRSATTEEIARYNDLIDEAMAICGHPYHQVSQGADWNEAELAFLTTFVEEPTEQELRDSNGPTPTQKRVIPSLVYLNQLTVEDVAQIDAGNNCL